MSSPLSIPPRSKSELTPPRELVKRLACLVGRSFRLAPGNNKTRTDGSNLRKRVAAVLEAALLPAPATEGTYRILPPKAKGVTKLRREWVDTFIVTSGDSYNLQVWNRNPSEPLPQIEYADGSTLLASNIRFVLVRVGPSDVRIRCVVVLTPQYIVEHFGKFGKPTVKEQMIICDRKRPKILSANPPILFHPDEASAPVCFEGSVRLGQANIHDEPAPQLTIPLNRILRFVRTELIGR